MNSGEKRTHQNHLNNFLWQNIKYRISLNNVVFCKMLPHSAFEPLSLGNQFPPWTTYTGHHIIWIKSCEWKYSPGWIVERKKTFHNDNFQQFFWQHLKQRWFDNLIVTFWFWFAWKILLPRFCQFIVPAFISHCIPGSGIWPTPRPIKDYFYVKK